MGLTFLIQKKNVMVALYKLFYWLELTTDFGKCNSILSETGIKYRHVIDNNFYVDYCFEGNIPKGIFINRHETGIYIEINRYSTRVNDTVEIPKLCFN